MWIRHFLLDRKGHTDFQGRLSDTKHFQNGTPQGSVLIPSIYNFLINRIISTTLPTGITPVVYADDLALVGTGTHLDLLLQTATSQIELTTKSLGLNLAQRKAEAIYFGRF